MGCDIPDLCPEGSRLKYLNALLFIYSNFLIFFLILCFSYFFFFFFNFTVILQLHVYCITINLSLSSPHLVAVLHYVAQKNKIK